MRRLLIVDDDSVNREIFRWALDDRFEIDELPNGIGAAEAILSGHYDLVLLDIMMPIIDGVEVIESIDAADYEHLRRVLVVTSAVNPDLHRKLSRYPVAGVVERPYQPEDINSIINAYAA